MGMSIAEEIKLNFFLAELERLDIGTQSSCSVLEQGLPCISE